MIVGTIGSPRRAHVQGGGVVVLHAGTRDELRIDWWIGADDRWYRPSTEITTRQHLVRNAPIVQTSVRIPSGDAVLTTFGAVQGQRELVVCDVENRSKVPFAVAIILRGPGVRNVSVDGAIVRVDGFPLLTFPRAPQRFACVPAGEDLGAVVMSGAADVELDTVAGASEVALILPVTHSTTLRFVALLGAASGVALLGTPVLSSLPEAHRAAAGWGVHLGRLPQITLPDSELNASATANGGALLLAAEPGIASTSLSVAERASMAFALAIYGCVAESGALLEDVGGLQLANGSFGRDDVLISAHMVRALATHALISRDGVFAETFAPVIAGGLEYLLKQSKRSKKAGSGSSESGSSPLAALANASWLFEVAGDAHAAAQCRKAHAKAGSPWPLPNLPLPPLPPIGPGGSLVPDELIRLSSTVAETLGQVASVETDGAMDLLSGFRIGWRGAKIDVRNVATSAGKLSFSLRWHGARPALLWDVSDPTGVALHLRCSAIDASWSGSGSKGDALLNVDGSALREISKTP